MLTTDQKETILRKAGVAVPGFPAGRVLAKNHDQLEHAGPAPKDQGEGAARRAPAAEWARTIDTLYVEYSAARAAKSLRDAEEARRLDALRHASARAGG